MFKVECPGCQAPYQVDERRVPAAGLRMRCPKCGNTFPVSKPGESSETTLLGASSKPPAGGPQALKGTMIGMAAQGARPPPPRREKRHDATVIGVPAPAGAAAPAGAPPAAAPKGAPPRAPAAAPGTLVGKSTGTGTSRASTLPASAPGTRPLAIGGPSGGFALRGPASPPLAPKHDDDLPAVFGGGSGKSRSSTPAVTGSSGGSLPNKPSRPDIEQVLPAVRVDKPLIRAEKPLVPKGSSLSLELDASFAAVMPKIDSSPGFEAIEPFALAAEPPPPFETTSPFDLPSPKRDFGSDLTQELAFDDGVFGEVDLPSVVPLGRSARPAPLRLDVPLGAALKGSSRPSSLPPANPFDDPFALPELDMPTGVSGQKSFTASFPGFEVPRPAAPEPAKSPAVDFDDHMSGMDPFDATLESAAPPAAETKGISAERAGAQYGEVDLGGGSGGDLDDDDVSAASGLDTDDGMEFGAIPQEAAPAAADAPAARTAATVPVSTPAPVVASRALENRAPQLNPPKRSRGLWIGAGAVLSLAVAGGALALLPEVGPYGVYFVSDVLQQGARERRLSELHRDVAKLRGDDSEASSRKALQLLEKEYRASPRYRPFAAYLAFALYSHMLRFGDDSAVQAQAKVLLGGLEGLEPAPWELNAARALERALAADFATARSRFQRLGSAGAKSVELWAAIGEVELRAGDAQKAKEAWQKAAALAENTWTAFGQARSAQRLGDLKLAREGVTKVVAQQPGHTGAKLLLAELAWSDEDEATAVAELEQVLAAPAAAVDQVAARTLLGEIHLERGRLSKAESEFIAALGVQSQNVRALCGLGDVFFEAGRYTAAQARYETAVTADAQSVRARIGVARTLIHLDRLKDALQGLAKLQGEQPANAEVAYWLGRATEVDGKRDAAKAAYRNAIKLAGPGDAGALPYVALAQLLRQEGALDEASSLLAEALAKLPASAELRKAQGEVLLTQGRYDQALAEFEAARKLEPADVGVLFDVAVAQRKLGRIEQAFGTLDAVAKLDPELPGLPLERGLLLELSDRGAEALKEYEAALAKAPDDPDLMLRVGCARVAAGDGGAARPMLEKVLEKRPRSADTYFCLGRAFLLQEKLLEAMQNLGRATELDPNRAEYFVYVARAANAAGQVSVAQQAIDTALALDQGIADAFWQKGVLLLRQGAALDALAAFDKALELRPTLYEAHADRAQAYYQVGKEVEALEEWEQAVRHDGRNPTWHFRYGKLLAMRRLNERALPHLLEAIKIGQGMEPKPAWLWQAHQLAATTLGPTAAALPHWRTFLELSPDDSPYRDEAKQALARAGQAYAGP